MVYFGSCSTYVATAKVTKKSCMFCMHFYNILHLIHRLSQQDRLLEVYGLLAKAIDIDLKIQNYINRLCSLQLKYF